MYIYIYIYMYIHIYTYLAISAKTMGQPGYGFFAKFLYIYIIYVQGSHIKHTFSRFTFRNHVFTLYISTRFTLRYLLQFSMQKILVIVLLILSIICVHAELKLKLQNISSCVVNFTVIKD